MALWDAIFCCSIFYFFCHGMKFCDACNVPSERFVNFLSFGHSRFPILKSTTRHLGGRDIDSSCLFNERNSSDQRVLLDSVGTVDSLVERQKDDYVWYFSYGANMCKRILSGRHGIQPLISTGAQSVDENFGTLAFCHREGYANLVPIGSLEHTWGPQFDGPAHGVLHLIKKEELETTLSKVETGYMLKKITVEGYHKEIIQAHTFISSPLLSLSKNLSPTKRYLTLLQDGAQEHQLDPEYIAWLQKTPSIESSADFTAEYYDTPSKFIALAVPVLLFGIPLFFLLST